MNMLRSGPARLGLYPGILMSWLYTVAAEDFRCPALW